MTDTQKRNNDPLKEGDGGWVAPTFNVTGVASLTNSSLGARTGIMATFTMPSGYVMPKSSVYILEVPDGFGADTTTADWLLIVVNQPSGSWSNAVQGSFPTMYLQATNNNSLEASDTEFCLNIGEVVNPSVAGKSADIKIWVNYDGGNRCLVTCPGVMVG